MHIGSSLPITATCIVVLLDIDLYLSVHASTYEMPEPAVQFGHLIRASHFNFDKAYIPLNHGSFGAFPKAVRDHQRELQSLSDAKPDTFIRHALPELIENSRVAVAPLLGVPVGEVVFVPNATTAINTVLRSLVYEKGDVVVYFNTIYHAEWNTLKYVCEVTPLESICIGLDYPLEDSEVLGKFTKMIEHVRRGGRRVRVAMFDTVTTFPGVRMPWEDLVVACKQAGILSLVDGAHGIGHIDMAKVGQIGPDFLTSNCYK